MNTAMKYIAVGTAGLVIGGVVGLIVSNKRADKIIARELARVDAEFKTALDDARDRIQKKGNYETVEKATATLISSEVQDLLTDEDGDIDVEQWRKETGSANAKEFIEKFKDRVAVPYGGVTFPGQDTDDETDEVTDEYLEHEETPVSSVPEFVFKRDPNGPYLISIDMYMEDYHDSPFTKSEVTYFEGDDVVVDVNSQIITDAEGLLGVKNLSRFGEGTTDADQMYIRNERLEIDIEVTRDEGTYTRKVLGIVPEDEIARSMIKGLKMRESDDS